MNYHKVYHNIVANSLQYIAAGYTENHHIVPKCIGGTNDKDNLVRISAKAHYVMHHLLTKMYPDQPKLWYAYNMMKCGSNGHRIYAYMHEKNRQKMCQIISANNTGKLPYNKGIPKPKAEIEQIQDLWKFISPTGEEYVEKGLREFCERHGLHQTAMWSVCHGRMSNHRGWKIIKLTNITDTCNKPYIPKKRKTGTKAKNGIKISINGVEYDSIGKAEAATGISRHIINRSYRVG